MSNETALAATLVAEGRFQAAMAFMKERISTIGCGVCVADRLLMAELLERTGHLPEAKAQLLALKKTPRLTESERARYYLVDGLLSKQLGHLEDSVRAFRRAYQLSERHGSPELLAWCQLRFLSVSADLDGAQIDPELLSVLRCNVEKAAVPAVSIAHRIFLAEYLAKRGDLDASRHHSDIAGSLLRSFPNHWLRGLLDLHQSCLDYLDGDFLDSLVAARHALASSIESGHLLTGVIALADMAAAYLAVGQAARATACLSVALRKPGREEQVWGLLLETLAEAQLVSGDVDGCAESLRTAREQSARHSQSRSAWHRDWNLRTEVRLLQRLGRWQESLGLIRNAQPRGHSDSRSFPRVQIEALEALAYSRLRKPDDARSVIRGYLQSALETPRASRSVTLAASGALLAVAAGDKDALPLSVHALRVVGATGEASSLVEVVDQLLELANLPSREATEAASKEEQGPLWRPTNLVCHLDDVTPALPGLECSTDNVGTFLCSLVDLAGDPLAAGEEMLRRLVSMGWISSGAIIQSAGTGASPVVTFAYPADKKCPDEWGAQLPTEAIRMALGARQSRSFDALIWPTQSARAVSGCYGLARLVAAIRHSSSPELPVSTGVGEEANKPQIDDSEGLFRSPAMLALLASARRVAPLDITVLLTGESGTGKEVIAKSIHRASGRPEEGFVAFNCSTVPRDMVDSQLFGYRRGAFTGAVQGFGGVINAAHGGTLLLDEVGELPLDTQPKLLRFLDTGEVQALGEAAPRKPRVRVIAATNAILEDLVQQGKFREDLFYRLNVVRFRLPPLRERREEVAPLIAMFLSKCTAEFGKQNIGLSEAAMEHLLLYHWPGNVRELSHEVRRLVALGDSDSVIGVLDLDMRIRGQSRAPVPPTLPDAPRVTVRIDRPLDEIAEEIERAAIAHAIEVCKGRLDLAAERLGLSRKGLYLKRQRFGFL